MSQPSPSLSVPRRWAGLAAVVGVVFGYTLAVDPVVTSLGQVLYPVVWVLASVVALWTVVRPRWGAVSPGALAAGGAYLLVLLWTAGLVAPGGTAPALSVHLGIPGWGPAVRYSGPFVSVTLVPFLVLGYVTLGLLAAVAVDAVRKSAVLGVLGLFACVSCTAPLLAGIAGSLGAGGLGAALLRAQYPVATAAFLLSLGAFAWVVRQFDARPAGDSSPGE